MPYHFFIEVELIYNVSLFYVYNKAIQFYIYIIFKDYFPS